MKILNYLKDFIKTRTTGFYISSVGALLCLISSFIYWGGYVGSPDIGSYYNVGVPLLLLFGSLIFVGMILFDVTSKFATPVLWIITLAAFCLDIRTSYMYLTTVFFGGVTWDAFATMNMGFFLPLLFMLIALILSFIGIIKKQGRKETYEDK